MKAALLGIAGTANASSPGDQDAVTYAAEVDAASPFARDIANGAVQPTTPLQARNRAGDVCMKRQAGYSESAVIAWREVIDR